jgi:predicted nucleotidyltransferase
MTPSLAHEPRSRDQIAAATNIIRDVLGNAALAAYSTAVAGGLHPDSDLDILTVSNRPLINDERAAIIERLLPISGLHAIRGRPADRVVDHHPACPCRMGLSAEH